MMLRRAAFPLCLAAVGLTQAQSLQASDELLAPVAIGVRTDARPFAYLDSGTGRGGYLYQLCVEAVARTGHGYILSDATPKDRDGLLYGGEKKFDVLCDPTTLTIERMYALTNIEPPGYYGFTPIVFTASSVVVEGVKLQGEQDEVEPGNGPPPQAGVDCKSKPPVERVAVVDLTTASDSITRVRSILNSSSTGDAKEASSCRDVKAEPKENYTKAIAAFCEGKVRFLAGDLDIIRETISRYDSHTDVACRIEGHHALQYEPYALIVSSRIPGFREKFIMSLYEIFADRRAVRILDRHFATEERKISPYVDMLFRMYQIPAGKPRVNPRSNVAGTVVQPDN